MLLHEYNSSTTMAMEHLALVFLLFSSFSSYILTAASSAEFGEGEINGGRKLESLQKPKVIIRGNASVTSVNRTFRLGFFAPNADEFRWYLGIWYASIPIRTYVWVANREKPIENLQSARAEINEGGKLAVVDEGSGTILWETNNVERASDLVLLEQGNLVLLSSDGGIVWRSFDFPADTWLPGMNLTAERRLVSWRSSVDPSPGRYSLRLNPPGYGEIALFYSNYSVDDVHSYWSTGNWSGDAFDGVPEMTIPYIYRFKFLYPFTPMATFGYSEVPLESGALPPLTRFLLDHTGQLKQFTWSQQSEFWSMFWSQPENVCRVYALCGNLGVCSSGDSLNPCRCLNGFGPVNSVSWDKEDFSGGCWRGDSETCGKDGFEEVGVVSYQAASVVSFSGSRKDCESACLRNCSCVGLYHNAKSNACSNLYGSLLNLRNFTADSTIQDTLYVRVQSDGAAAGGRKRRTGVLIGLICGVLVILSIGTLNLLYWMRRKVRRRKGEEEGVFQVSNLRVFSYKELHAATKGFSEKLGHGGFGAVFRGELLDSSTVAVKRLERPGGGEKEFRAEVCTIGNIQHVNLVRLRGFCCESLHRLLVYDYMPNGPLSKYLRQDGQCLSWDVRFRVAVGTARGIAYLHEECRNCIIHCDIKPENILLDEGFAAKVSDFGLAKLVGRDFSRVLATMRGTWGYVAPEWISGVAITTKADVYSYGMTLLELIGGRRNVEGPPSSNGGGNQTEKWFFPPWAARQIIEGNTAAVVDHRLSGAYDEAEAERAALVGVWCIQDEESARPTMGTVVKMLEGVVEMGVPPPPKLLQALVSGESFQGVGEESRRRARQACGGSSADEDEDDVSKELPIGQSELGQSRYADTGADEVNHNTDADAHRLHRTEQKIHLSQVLINACQSTTSETERQ
ncbi:G-type lectin S-receptor-like serine/threonine-protein kinase SD2-2 [Andrographis paniculata]|uniref:G-type lectin S-receptor-like serine/threonine-protein kinase SD2-2 n=1 Tax=Andrographis paniculata TaxID=175694 RepID=UPI0021E7F9BF|nr:G-type lectin S-receptor-like serine/threonine-protein kinase SD2-2 [Andrographis paniculata]XP_051126285.1 G-type lectin S-receptor-like serine/threonine-protein kinase SD2-2 [Andrographis paniculata]